jgi:hypothetical protein
MDMDNLNGIMANIIMENGKKEKNMEVECGVLKKEILILENGIWEKFKGKEFIQPQTVISYFILEQKY